MPLAPPALSVAQRPYQHYPLSPVPSESQCACADGACLNALAGPSSLRPLRRHVCPTCSKTFTTNGHLRRHARIHTGEKHACPFPGCHKMCSRQDNLQQHYKSHLASCFPKLSKSKAKVSPSPEMPFAGAPTSEDDDSVKHTSPSLVPPTLDSSSSSQSSEYSSYSAFSSPPDTPPQLVQATLPDILPSDVPIAPLQAADSPCEAITPDIPSTFFYALTPNEWQQARSPCHVPLAHPIPRISQARSRLLDNACYDAYNIEPTCQLPQHMLLFGSEQYRDMHEAHPVSAYAPPQPGPPILLGPLELPDYASHGFDPVQQPSYYLTAPSHAAASYCSQLDERVRVGCFPAPLCHAQTLYN